MRQARAQRRTSSNLTKARKETKRLQRVVRTKLRKAKQGALRSGNNIYYKNIVVVEKGLENYLTPMSKLNYSSFIKHNVNWEKGRAMQLKQFLGLYDAEYLYYEHDWDYDWV